MTPSLRGWEAFQTPGALTHIRITWSLSPMAPQTQVSLRGPPCAHGVAGTPHGEVRDSSGKGHGECEGDSEAL
jgi:hypothetical protein